MDMQSQGRSVNQRNASATGGSFIIYHEPQQPRGVVQQDKQSHRVNNIQGNNPYLLEINKNNILLQGKHQKM